ncbi:MAG: tetratricopeptide repeat protein [Chloroflexota bacterium]
MGNKLKEALDLNDMGASLRHSARWQDALDALAESLKLRKSVGGLRLQVITLDHMAVCNIELGNEAKGIELLNEALKIAERLKIKREISRLMWGWGRLMQIRGNYAEALDYWQKSLDLANDIENHHQRAGAMGKMAEIYIREYGRNDEARELLEQSITILEEAQLTQGFGGMYITDMQALIADAEQA